jgi:hypothetical protein
VYDRGNSGVPGERECKSKKNDGEIQMWERGERKQVLDGRRGKKKECAMRRENVLNLYIVDFFPFLSLLFSFVVSVHFS